MWQLLKRFVMKATSPFPGGKHGQTKVLRDFNIRIFGKADRCNLLMVKIIWLANKHSFAVSANAINSK